MNREPVCAADHHFYIAETASTEDPPTAHVFIICTDCGEAQHKKFVLSPDPPPALPLLANDLYSVTDSAIPGLTVSIPTKNK
ncbi:hypothetical protein LCGC14_1690340 [marine sediment metagenome]|uniref:Uncharacterized protein n=1 Tax=marine sediment metagenome TaxID=412755 RepID=A0A0F9K1G0_9ZZZZ